MLHFSLSYMLVGSSRNYNPVDRRSKGGKERCSKGSHRISKSLQANNLNNSGSGEGMGLNKTSGQLLL